MLQITFLIFAGDSAPYEEDFSGMFDDIARINYGRIFNMENGDIGIILNDIREQTNNKNIRHRRTVNSEALSTRSTADDSLPKVYILPANMSLIDEDEPLTIECSVETSDSATVLLKRNDEIIHEWHIP